MGERLADYIAASRRKELAMEFLRLVALLAANADAKKNGLPKAASDARHFARDTPIVIRLLDAAVRGQIYLHDDELVIKAAVDAATTTNSSWAQPLLDFQAVVGPYLEVERAITIVGQLPTRTVGFNQLTIEQTVGPIAQWVGESLPIPLSASGFAAHRLLAFKLAVIFVVSSELQRYADPAMLRALQDDAGRSVREALDKAFIDPGFGPSSSRPASITWGVTPRHSTGASISAISADTQAAVQVLIDAGSDLRRAYWIMHPGTGLSLSAMRGADGTAPFPNVTPLGGFLFGLPVLTSAAAQPSGSPGERFLVCVDADRVVVADAGLTLSASENAALQMTDAPAAGAQNLISLWQNNLSAIRLTRILSWEAMPGSVSLIDNVVY